MFRLYTTHTFIKSYTHQLFSTSLAMLPTNWKQNTPDIQTTIIFSRF